MCRALSAGLRLFEHLRFESSNCKQYVWDIFAVVNGVTLRPSDRRWHHYVGLEGAARCRSQW
ncbi:hypothetical protein MPTK1_7g13600 [Marchantia polymorpha subsp. ruderalis]|uniref:Uncharacterized protein n=1 Tax=Marchantia polymorpha subsp. ruderalis TaxID=1480154 RepID=A0AAF6BZ85_MARPO|nr:hypothetical protein Mp_7g13600 [Marchantia polymorpha subsp. ruderalis]